MDDRKLNDLLREWKAPNAPPHLRPRPAPRSWLNWLVTGTVRVPVPAAVAVLLLAAVWGVSTWSDSAPETAGPRPNGELARYALSGPLEGFDAVIVELNFPPDSSAAAHRHPGPILGYVVDGQLRFAINYEPDQILPPGNTFFEPSGVLHTSFGSASLDAPARVLAFLVVPTGSPLTGPA